MTPGREARKIADRAFVPRPVARDLTDCHGSSDPEPKPEPDACAGAGDPLQPPPEPEPTAEGIG